MMNDSSKTKYIIHIIFFFLWVIGFEIFFGAVSSQKNNVLFDPLERYGTTATVLLYLVRIVSLLVLPQCICNTLGWLLFNGFKNKVQLRASPLLAPFVCFRVVTKGNFPNLVKQNVAENIKLCYKVGLENFMFEIVTDKSINLENNRNSRIRELVVPTSYRTKTNAKFKARALQYCLESDVNILRDEDWVVHLDEETLLTTDSICGILNFCDDGKHQFGQGVITYANGEIVNWVTTLSDSFRVADDMGKLRFQFHFFHKPLFGWKGSFVVTQVGAERKVSFDHGLEGSIAEDCFFSMIAYRDGYSFNFIEGEMHEKSPFTFWDFLQQRKRWIQGIYLTVHSKFIPLRYKLFLGSSLYAWATMPLTSLQIFFCFLWPLPKFMPLDVLVAFVGAVNLYMYVFGVILSFPHKYRKNIFRLFLYTIGALFTIPFNIWIENIAVILGMFSCKDDFYIVNKELVVFQV